MNQQNKTNISIGFSLLVLGWIAGLVQSSITPGYSNVLFLFWIPGFWFLIKGVKNIRKKTSHYTTQSNSQNHTNHSDNSQKTSFDYSHYETRSSDNYEKIPSAQIIIHSDDPFEILNLPRSATKEEIKKRYWQIAKIYHFNGILAMSDEEKKNREEIMKKVNEAKEYLFENSC